MVGKKHIKFFIALLLGVGLFFFLNHKNPTVVQAAFPGWNNITIIYYNPSQDDSVNKFLEQAANELKNNLAKVGKTLTINTISKPGLGTIYLEVNSAHPELASRNDEAFKLYSDANGIYITGKTPLAARHGAYAFLEKLGFRWFFKHSAWWVTPTSLIDPGTLNEVREPFFLWRQFWMWPSDWPTYHGDSDLWTRRNRLFGAKDYRCTDTYNAIIPASKFKPPPAPEHEWFLPEDVEVLPPHWQLNPDHPTVISEAISYARRLLPQAPHSQAWTADKLSYRAISLQPNDYFGWYPPWNASWSSPWGDNQIITDKVFGLAKDVAVDIQGDFPDAYVCVPNYGATAFVPTIALNPNMLVPVTTEYNYSSLTLNERIDGLMAKGVLVGVREYTGLWSWWHDLPLLNFPRILAIPGYANKGIRVFITETGDCWGGFGLSIYATSKMLWDPSQDFNALLTDFYQKAFGNAWTVMKRYYERYAYSWPPYQNPPLLLDTVGQNFKDLADAESLVAGNNEYLERIRQLEYYQRFLWFYHVKKLTNLSLDELKSFYTFVTKLKDLYIITYQLDEPVIRNELINNRGLSTSTVLALQNFTPPTALEASTWLKEALVAFGYGPSVTPGDLDKDGDVDITDVSIMMSNWGRTDSAALQQCDINPGPNNISKDKIDLFDANLMMKNWTLTP